MNEADQTDTPAMVEPVGTVQQAPPPPPLVTQIADLVYVDPTNTLIDVTVTHRDLGIIRFTYRPDDGAETTLAVKALLASGNYTIAPYMPPPAAQA